MKVGTLHVCTYVIIFTKMCESSRCLCSTYNLVVIASSVELNLQFSMLDMDLERILGLWFHRIKCNLHLWPF